MLGPLRVVVAVPQPRCRIGRAQTGSERWECPVPDSGTRTRMESRLFRRFKDRSLPHLTFTPHDDWEWLAVAQYFGLPTRLLDWSGNPLVPAYFAGKRQRDAGQCRVRL